MVRALAVALLLILCAGCVGQSGPQYTGKVERPGDDGIPSEPFWNPRVAQIQAFGNTGKDIQQLLAVVDSHGTFSVRDISGVLALDPAINHVDMGQGGVYLPLHRFTPPTVSSSGHRWIWNFGPVPHGWHAIMVLRIRLRKPLPHHGHVLDLKWYAATSPNQPLSKDTEITGVYQQF